MPNSGLLEWNLTELKDALRITEDDVRTYFTDGRRISFILERRLAREVLQGTLAPSEGAGFDLIDGEGRKWEVRSISKGGIYFCPSYMVGSGRKFEKGGFLTKLGSIHGYVVSDITAFPRVPYWLIEGTLVRQWWDTGRLGPSTQISRDKALNLVGRMS